MALKTYICCFVLCCYCWFSSIAQSFVSPRADTLEAQYNTAIYATQFAEAQTILYQYLSQTNLSIIERFYGEYLQACVYRSAGSPNLSAERFVKLKTQIQELPESKQPAFKAVILGKLAECYFDQHIYDTAYIYAKQSIAVKPYLDPSNVRGRRSDTTLLTEGNPLRSNGHAINYLILGAYESFQQNFAAAQSYYNKSLQIYQQNSDFCETPLAYIKIAHLKLAQGDQTSSLADLQKALAISDSCNIKQYRFLTRASLVYHYRLTGQFEKAVNQYEEFNQISNEIYKDEQRIHINELQIKYKTELAERQRQTAAFKEQQAANKVLALLAVVGILLLILTFVVLILRLRQAQNQKLEEKVQQIQRQKQERDALLKEVHHRVKNNLQIITSLLHLESTKQHPVLVGNSNNALFQSSQDRINAMALIHELLYQSETLATIPLKEYLHNLFNTLTQSHGNTYQNIELQLDLPTIELDLDTATPLGLLFNEIITNSLMHGFQDRTQGAIYIRGQQLQTNHYVFYIGDNGAGCDDTVDFDPPKTLGFNLMRRLARQLNGQIEWINHNEKGCHYKFTIQLAQSA